MTPFVTEVNTISEAVRVAIEVSYRWSPRRRHSFWFRGVKDRALSLQPGAYWRENYDEWSPLVDFTQSGPAFSRIGSIDDWETYYLAQHHGIPTRLLDWTSSFVSALFFAADGWDDSTVPCVWMLYPGLLNKCFVQAPGTVSPENNPQCKLWLPRQLREGRQEQAGKQRDAKFDNQYPLAIYPKKVGSRIIAQLGSFTVHGVDKHSIDEQLSSMCDNVDDILHRIDLVGLSRDEVMFELDILGTRRSTIYPDIDNFVRQLADFYGW